MTEENICLSGGADGADIAWGEVATKHGHRVVHYSFDCHKTMASEPTRLILSQDDLNKADQHLIRANQTLGRTWPPRNLWTANLLRRNYYQIKDSESVYAISSFDDQGLIVGGTAWAVEMFLNLHGPDEVYVFDQERNDWFFNNGLGWISCSKCDLIVPEPNGIWTGIGTRDLNENGLKAIESVFSS